MAIALVNQASVEYNVDGTSTPLTIALPTVGNLLVVCWMGSASLPLITSISGGGVTTWSSPVNQSTNMRTSIWYGLVDGTPGTALTISHASITAVIRHVYCAEFSGSATASISGATNTSSGKSTTMRSGAITTTASGSLAVSACATQGGISAGPTGGFTDLTTPGVGVIGRAAYLVTTTVGSYEPTYTTDNSNYGGVIAEFKAGGTLFFLSPG